MREYVDFGPPIGAFWIQTDELGVCDDGVLTILSGCDSSTSASDDASIELRGGDDRIAPITSGYVSCGSGYRVYPFKSSWDFGMVIEGGDGEDEIYGSPNDDILRSNYVFVSGWIISYPNDNDDDLLCGYDGNDTLDGDGTVSTPDEPDAAGSCLDGQSGSDSENAWGEERTPPNCAVSCLSTPPTYF